MMQRTSLVLDEPTRRAARALASAYGCSVSEAIRRAVVHQHALVKGVDPRTRERRKRALEQLFDLFEGNDPVEEVRRLKVEDSGF